ncbi:hypothetical protein CBL_06064 [Carabus blaptoides fortunei]
MAISIKALSNNFTCDPHALLWINLRRNLSPYAILTVDERWLTYHLTRIHFYVG